MIILRSNLYSSKKDNFDNPTKAYLAGSAGFLGTGGYLLKTATKNSFKKKLKSIGPVLPEKVLTQAAGAQGGTEEELITRYLELKEKNNKNKQQISRARRSIINRRIAGRALLAAGVGLGTAAGYRYYKNKQKNDNKN